MPIVKIFGPPSNVVSGTPLVAPVVLSGVAESGGVISFQIAWTDPEATVVNVYRDTAAGATSFLESIDVSALASPFAYEDDTGAPGTDYFYRATLEEEDGGVSAYSNEVGATTSAGATPAATGTLFITLGSRCYGLDLDAWEADNAETAAQLALVSNETAIVSCAVDPGTGDVYLACLATDKIVRLDYDGTGDRALGTSYTQSDWKTGMDNPGKLRVVDDGGTPTLVFISRGLGLAKAPLSNPASVTVLANPTNVPAGLAVRGSVVYYSTNVDNAADPDGLRSVNLDGTGDTHIVASDKLVGIATDADDIYYTQATATVSKTYRRDAGGATETWLDGVPDYPLDIVEAGGYLYMAAFDDGQVRRFETSAAAGSAAAATGVTVFDKADVAQSVGPRGVAVLP